MTDSIKIRRALLSVSDKTDLVPFARSLASHGVEIISTGGTARMLGQAGIKVTPIDQVTGFPEMMDGRVKTLHPNVHGGLLGLRDNPEHIAAMAEHGIEPIDLVCINLYPFERTISQPDVAEAEAIEQIDIGGPSMIRSAAKNFAFVTVVTSPSQYDSVVNDMAANDGTTSQNLRAELATTAFGRTSEYDATIASYLSRRSPGPFPEVMRLAYVKADSLRYGENPHQQAALYRDPSSIGPTIVNARQLYGKQLGYNNINDAAAALEVVKALRKLDPDHIGACVVKHTNTCGAATGSSCHEALDLAIAGDPLAAYGGIVAINQELDQKGATRLCEKDVFFEVIVAPEFSKEAAAALMERWKNVRLLAVGERKGSTARKFEYRSVPGGLLVQDRDTRPADVSQWQHAAGPAPSPQRLAHGAVIETICRFLSSNAIAIGKEDGTGARLLGAGAGQMDRVTACQIAVEKADGSTKGTIAASDAFFPFPDGPQVLIDAGVTMIVHPGGSKRDAETFKLCDDRGVTCMVTGVRHFRH